MTKLHITTLICFALWFGAVAPLAANETINLQKQMIVDGSGRILSVGYSDHDHGYSQNGSPIIEKHLQLLKAIKKFAKGRAKSEIKVLLGNPRHIETGIPSTVWPEVPAQSDEQWLYTCGPNTWGTTFVLCFEKEKCISCFDLSPLQRISYTDWKVASFHSTAIGMTSANIEKTFGKPWKRSGPERIVLTKADSDKKPYDKVWNYRFLDQGGVTLGFYGDKCSMVAEFATLH